MKLKVKLYDIYIVTITFMKAIGLTADSKLYLLALVFGCAVVFMKVCMEKYRPKELLGMIVIVAIGILNLVVARGTSVLTTAIALCGLKNVDSDRIIKISFWTRLVGFLLMIILSTTGVIENKVIQFWREDGYISRSLFGYEHANTAHMIFAINVLLALYLYGPKMRLAHYALLMVCNQWLYFYTGSRTGWVVAWASIICYLLTTSKKAQPVVLRCFRHSYILLAALTLVLGLGYGRIDFVTKLNTLMTGRLNYISRILSEEAVTLFGKTEYQSIIVDNGWIKLLYMGGLFVFLWFSYYITKAQKRLYQQYRTRELFLITCFLIYNMAESFIDAFSLNVSLVFIGELMFDNKKIKLETLEVVEKQNICIR